MSHDQRPGRVRVFSSGNPAETPQRRRTDPKPAPLAASLPDAPAPASTRSLVVRAVLFLVACLAGGAIASACGLLEMVGR